MERLAWVGTFTVMRERSYVDLPKLTDVTIAPHQLPYCGFADDFPSGPIPPKIWDELADRFNRLHYLLVDDFSLAITLADNP